MDEKFIVERVIIVLSAVQGVLSTVFKKSRLQWWATEGIFCCDIVNGHWEKQTETDWARRVFVRKLNDERTGQKPSRSLPDST